MKVNVWNVNIYLMPYDLLSFQMLLFQSTNNLGRNSLPLPPLWPAKLRNNMGELSRGKHKGKETFELCCKSSILSLYFYFSISHTLYLFLHLLDLLLTRLQQKQNYTTVSCLRLIWSLICQQPESFALFLHTQWEHFINPPYWFTGGMH